MKNSCQHAQELQKYLNEAENLRGFKRELQILLFRYLSFMPDTLTGIDKELDRDFFTNFANLLEILDVRRSGSVSWENDFDDQVPRFNRGAILLNNICWSRQHTPKIIRYLIA